MADETKQLDFGLITLTEAISLLANEAVSHGLLGGKFGYGANYENDVFMMHPYCWCEKEECNWCFGNAPNFLHKPTSFSVNWYKWIGRDMIINNESGSDIPTIMRECVDSLTADMQKSCPPNN